MALPLEVALGALIAACVIYLAAIAWLWWNQRSFIYPAPTVHTREAVTPDIGSEVVRLTTDDGVNLYAFYRPARPGWSTIIFFHGNGDSLAGSQQATRLLAARGYGLLLPEYRGYGGNQGSPTERGLYYDGGAALSWLMSHGVAPDQTIVIGNSLGSGVATELASRNRLGALVLISAFTSMADVVRDHLWFIPARWLVRDRYENLRKLPRVLSPVLVLHGIEDTLISLRHGRALANARPKAILSTFSGAGHELAYTDASQEKIAAWLHRVVR